MAMAKKRLGIYRQQSRCASVPEAGAKLGISRDAAYRAAKAGDIPTVRIGSTLRVPVVQLEAF